jgi:hypothetical protein
MRAKRPKSSIRHSDFDRSQLVRYPAAKAPLVISGRCTFPPREHSKRDLPIWRQLSALSGTCLARRASAKGKPRSTIIRRSYASFFTRPVSPATKNIERIQPNAVWNQNHHRRLRNMRGRIFCTGVFADQAEETPKLSAGTECSNE